MSYIPTVNLQYNIWITRIIKCNSYSCWKNFPTLKTDLHYCTERFFIGNFSWNSKNYCCSCFFGGGNFIFFVILHVSKSRSIVGPSKFGRVVYSPVSKLPNILRRIFEDPLLGLGNIHNKKYYGFYFFWDVFLSTILLLLIFNCSYGTIIVIYPVLQNLSIVQLFLAYC